MVSASDFTKTCDFSLFDFQCTPETCCLEQGHLQYIPTIAGNSLYAAIFILLIIPNLWFGIRSRTWSFTTWIVLGLIGEFVGYIGRIQLYNNIFDFNAFLTYLIPLTIAPAFITASIYLCLARIIYVVDPALQYSRFKPMTYTKIFVTFDFICLVLQGAGGGLAATANTQAEGDTGVNTMIAGLAFQVISLVLFSALCADFAWRLRKGSRKSFTETQELTEHNGAVLELRKSADADVAEVSLRFDNIKRTRMFKGFIWSLAIAVVLILVRSSYRLAELKDGFHGRLFNDEVTFMIFEGPMIFIACTLMTVFHPSLAMRGFWSLKDMKIKEKNEDTAPAEGWWKRTVGWFGKVKEESFARRAL